jgi:hypothetical protein
MDGERRIDVAGSPSRCPFCKGDLEGPKDLVACASCGARQHAACHAEHARCASCGSAEVLVRREAASAATPRPTFEPPLAGSKARVERRDDGLVYTWPLVDGTRLFGIMLVLMVCTAPIGAAILYYNWKQRQGYKESRSRLVLGTDALELFVFEYSKKPKLKAARGEVGAVRVSRGDSGARLAVDVGIHEQELCSSLEPAELEWLARAIEAWKNEA